MYENLHDTKLGDFQVPLNQTITGGILYSPYENNFNQSCSASEVRHPNEVRHLRFMTILKSFYCPFMAYMYTLPLKEDIPFI